MKELYKPDPGILQNTTFEKMEKAKTRVRTFLMVHGITADDFLGIPPEHSEYHIRKGIFYMGAILSIRLARRGYNSALQKALKQRKKII